MTRDQGKDLFKIDPFSYPKSRHSAQEEKREGGEG